MGRSGIAMCPCGRALRRGCSPQLAGVRIFDGEVPVPAANVDVVTTRRSWPS